MSGTRIYLLVFAACWFPAGAGVQAADKEQSWLGEKVMPSVGAPQFTAHPGNFQTPVDMPSAFFTVVEQENDWLQLKGEDGRRGWARQNEFVLLRDAPGFFTNLIVKSANDPWPWQMRGLARVNLKQFKAAIKDFSEVILLNPGDAGGFNLRAWTWLDLKEFDKALQDCTNAIQLDPRNLEVHLCLAMVWHDKKDYDRELKALNQAIGIDPLNAMALQWRANAWIEKQEYGRAVKDATEAIRLTPELACNWHNRGLAHASMKEYDRAIEDYSTAIHLDPLDFNNYIGRGTAWNDVKMPARALKDFDQAIRLNPDHAISYYYRGMAREALLDFSGALQDYEEAIRLDPSNSEAQSSRSVILFMQQRPEAVQGFRTALDQIGYQDPFAPYAVIMGHLGACRAGDRQAARQFLSESAGKFGSSWPAPVFRLLRGEIDSAALLKQARDMDERTEGHCYGGLVETMKGNKQAALQHFHWVREHGNKDFVEYRIALTELRRLEGR